MQLFKNNAYGFLTAGISETDSAIRVDGQERFPQPAGNDYFVATLSRTDENAEEAAWEIVKCTSRNSDMLIVERAQEGTEARAWAIGTRVEMRVTAETLDSFSSKEQTTEGIASSSVRLKAELTQKIGEIEASLIKRKTVGVPFVRAAHGVDNNLAHDNDFSTPMWVTTNCTIRKVGNEWAIRLNGAPDANAFITRTVGNAVVGQWYTASINVRFSASVTNSVTLWVRRSDGTTMAAAQVGPTEALKPIAVPFLMDAQDGNVVLIIDPDSMAQGQDVFVTETRIAIGSVFSTPLVRENRFGYPFAQEVSRAVVNYQDIGNSMAPDGTFKAAHYRQKTVGENAYIEINAPNAAHDKIALTFSVWIKPIVGNRCFVKLVRDNESIVGETSIQTLPMNQWSRLSVRGDFAAAASSKVRAFIDFIESPDEMTECLVWGESLDPDYSKIIFASLAPMTMHNVLVGEHCVIDGPGALAVFGPDQATPGDLLWITVTNGRSDNVLWGGKCPVMGRDCTYLLDKGNGTYRFVYLDDRKGWWRQL